jgi:hypothetical protein
MYGTWTLNFSPGRVAVDLKGNRVVEAPIQVSGNRVTFDSTDAGPAALLNRPGIAGGSNG